MLLLRRSGAVWIALVETTNAAHENFVLSFRRSGPGDIQRLLDKHDQVYGDADDLGDDDGD